MHTKNTIFLKQHSKKFQTKIRLFCVYSTVQLVGVFTTRNAVAQSDLHLTTSKEESLIPHYSLETTDNQNLNKTHETAATQSGGVKNIEDSASIIDEDSHTSEQSSPIFQSSVIHANLPQSAGNETQFGDASAIQKTSLQMQSTSFSKSLHSKSNPPKIGISNENLHEDILISSRDKFRQLLRSTDKKFLYEQKFVGSLLQETPLNFPRNSEFVDSRYLTQTEPVSAFDPNKIYTSVNGKVFELSATEYQSSLTDKLNSVQTADIETPKGWKIFAHNPPGSSKAKEIKNDRSIKLNQGELQSETISLASQFRIDESVTFTGQSTLIGKVEVPSNFDPSQVIVSVAGSDLQVSPNKEGYFELPGLPSQSSLQIVFWDANNILARSVQSFYLGKVKSNISVKLMKQENVVQLAQSFGIEHNTLRSGFCSSIDTNSSPVTQVNVVARDEWGNLYPIYYYGVNGLPEARRKSLSTDSRFCVFNVASSMISLEFSNPDNSVRRNIWVAQYPTSFSFHQNFNLTKSVYRPVEVTDLVDSTVVYERNKDIADRGSFPFADAENRSWIKNLDVPQWVNSKDFSIRADSAYQSQDVTSKENTTPIYFPFSSDNTFLNVEIDPIERESDFRSFTLLPSSSLLTQKILKSSSQKSSLFDYKETIKLSEIHASSLAFDFDARFSESLVSSNSGSLFVSLDLAKLGIENGQSKLVLRKFDGSEVEAKFLTIEETDSSKSVRHVRGFFVNLPVGQYSLLVSNRENVIRWYGIVRSLPGQLQTISL